MALPDLGRSIEKDGTVIGNLPVSAKELVGFHEYLKLTNFTRYVMETGFDLAVQLPLAQAQYDLGNHLSELKRYQEAVDAYSRALDIFPVFMEALDNRGLAKMDLGKFREAMEDFERSIAGHGPNQVPLCSLGECYLKLGEYDAAEKAFISCVAKWPEEPQFVKFRDMAQTMRILHAARGTTAKDASPKKPWWRVW
jgi:tetratricopeptide (TPR) repeat protein